MSTNDHQIELDAIEAFLRRASLIDLPFMVKGSIITRQYFTNPEMRKVADLDWVYLDFIDTDEDAGKLFSNWAIKVTETHLEDQVKFRSFKENDFWRYIDYAMNDDFPTVDTDLLCWVNGERNDRLGLDISYNLDIDYPPIELFYQPRIGEAFTLKSTCPLPLQVSWKLHQLLSRPRLKDVFDLIHLVQHPAFNDQILQQALMALKKECDRDNIEVKLLNRYFDGNVVEYLKRKETGKIKSSPWKLAYNPFPEFKNLNTLYLEEYKFFTSSDHFKYDNLSELFLDFSETLKQNGFKESLILDL